MPDRPLQQDLAAIAIFPDREFRKQNIREGHEFYSCRIKLIRIAAFSRWGALLKPVRVISPPGTYFVTFLTWQRSRLFVVESQVRLFLTTLYGYRRAGRFQLHGFVVMPEHVHLLLTPAEDVTIERAIQLIKGGYSHALGADLGRKREIWQRGFTDHRIRDAHDYAHHREYIHQNPVKRRLVESAVGYRYCSAFPGFKLDSWPAAPRGAFRASA